MLLHVQHRYCNSSIIRWACYKPWHWLRNTRVAKGVFAERFRFRFIELHINPAVNWEMVENYQMKSTVESQNRWVSCANRRSIIEKLVANRGDKLLANGQTANESGCKWCIIEWAQIDKLSSELNSWVSFSNSTKCCLSPLRTVDKRLTVASYHSPIWLNH